MQNIMSFVFLFSFLICSFSFHSLECLMVVIVLCSQWFASEVEEKSQLTIEVLVIEVLVIEELVIEELVIEVLVIEVLVIEELVIER